MEIAFMMFGVLEIARLHSLSSLEICKLNIGSKNTVQCDPPNIARERLSSLPLSLIQCQPSVRRFAPFYFYERMTFSSARWGASGALVASTPTFYLAKGRLCACQCALSSLGTSSFVVIIIIIMRLLPPHRWILSQI
jgi:hypothetical protein